MPKYHFSENSKNGYDSGYESDGETSYQRDRDIGEGNYSKARLFKSKNDKTVVSLTPKNENINFVESQKKFHFFKILYPNDQVAIFINEPKTTYRLVIPEIPGCSFKSLTIQSTEEFINLFIAAIDALMDCHQKGLVVIDLKEDNIHFDEKNKKAFLIDGGLSSEIDEAVYPDIFKKNSLNDVEQARSTYTHLAPECWSTKEIPAATSMDIYTLGHMMERFGKRNNMILNQRLQKIIQSCTNKNPIVRPDLIELKKDLKQVKTIWEIMREENIILNDRQQQILIANPSLQQAIVQFTSSLKSSNFGRDDKTTTALEEYKCACIRIALQGKAYFKANYPAVKNKALSVIDHYRFQQFSVVVGNLLTTALATVSVIGLIAMAATSQQRGGFFLFKAPEQKLTQCADHLLKPLN